jgi:antitoxin PrlF
MGSIAKITSKGQITLPIEIRRALGVNVGDSVIFEKRGDEFRVLPSRTTSPFSKFRGSGIVDVEDGREAVIRAVRELRGEQ